MSEQRTDVTFPSGGEQCAAYVYRPGGEAGLEHPVPCIVMAHGFSATRDDALPGYAERFAEAGFACVVFDYRHFGASTGEPRQLLSVRRQHEDYRAAVAFARALDGIDPERIVLWGSSFSGGHVMQLAAEDPRIAAVIAQAPFTTGPSVVRITPVGNLLRASAEAIADVVGSLAGRAPRTIPAVGAPGTFAVMTAPEAEPGFHAITGAGSRWRNEVAARIMLEVGAYRPAAKAPQIQAPLLICACTEDQTTPAGPAMDAAMRAPRGELRTYRCGHFDIYALEQAKEDQLEFLTRHLLGEEGSDAGARAPATGSAAPS